MIRSTRAHADNALVLTLADINSVPDLAPYLAMLILGFLVGAWGTSSKSALAVIIGIVLILGAVFLLQHHQNDFGGLPPTCDQPPCP
jgi:hypothetical protein